MAENKKYYHNLDVVNNKVMNLLLNPLTTVQRTAIGGTLGVGDEGYVCFDTTLNQQYFWDGTTWITTGGGGGAVWGSITGTLTAQTDLTLYLSTNYYPLSTNPAGYLTTETDPVWTADKPSYLTSATAASTYEPIISAGTSGQYWRGDKTWQNFPSIPTVSPSALTKTDDTNVTLTLGGSPSTALLAATSLTLGWTGTLADSRITSATTWNAKEPGITAGTTSQYWRGDKTWQTFPTIPTVGTWGALNYPTWTTGTPFVKMTAAGTFALDTTSYQPLLTNPVTGTGTATRVAFWDSTSSLSSNSNLYWDNVNNRLGIGTATPGYKLDVNGEINTNVGIRLGTNGAQTGIYGGANIFDFWAGNSKIATWGLAASGGTHYDHFASPVYNTGDSGILSIFKIRGSVTSNSANAAGTTQLDISPIYTQQTFGTGTFRGVYYHPQLNSLNGSTHIAWENTTGDIIHGNLAGGGTQMVTVDNTGKLGATTIPTGGGGLLHGTASGTDTYTTTITGPTVYADGDAYLIRFTNGNTSTATLNINSIGAVTLYRNNDGVLIGGDITSGGEMLCIYNSTLGGFQCIGTSPNSLFAYVTNADSVTITKGMPVYAFGGTGDRMTVKRAYNTGDSTSAQTIGLVFSTSIAANQKGLIMMQGLLDGLSIFPTSTWNDGDPVYLGATAGSITPTKQYAPNHLVYLGFVTTASNGAAGRMYVRIQNGYELDELHNVQAQTPTLKDTLWYDNTVSPAQWKTASIPTILGYTPIQRSVNLVSSGTTAAGNTAGIDYVYLVSGTTTVTLPTAVGNTNRYTIKNSGTGVVSIATTSSQTIDDSASPITINVQYVSLDLISDGSNWEII